ncbi:hypothetical protein C9374_012493 [Naegleria lovaniensis]|uniref:Carrier domain-containing protein n=1 Tax=Naegleria lovaniensis TaxID=51637 RepID=A0AA88KQ87_NAELO|nr:uncharacterized protein C9374_012493 [Naegleria lovaniensis]KAG2392241.1 hypothetical protein C9374_012493 [Naegleria lovaniensis]
MIDTSPSPVEQVLNEFQFLREFYQCIQNEGQEGELLFDHLVRVLKLGNRTREIYMEESILLADEFSMAQEEYLEEKERKIKNIQQLLLIREEEEETSINRNDHTVMDEFMKHIREYKTFIMEQQSNLSDLEENPKMIKFTELNQQFNEQLKELQKKVDHWKEKIENLSIPWQVAYSASFDSSEQNGVVEFNSGKITDKFGNNLWEDRCGMCEVIIQSGAKGEGAPRYRCTSSSDKTATKCEHCYKWMKQIEKRYFSSPIVFDINNDTVISQDNDAVFQKAKQIDHFFGYPYVVEYNDVVFMKLNILNAPNLPTFVNNIFQTFSQRPCVGTRNKDGNFIFKTYEEFRNEIIHCSIGFIEVLKNAGILANSEQVSIAISTDENRYEYTMIDLMCALNGFISIGLQCARSDDELESIIRTASVQCIVCDGKLFEKYYKLITKLKDSKGKFVLISMDTQMLSGDECDTDIVTCFLPSIIDSGHNMCITDPNAKTMLGIQLTTPIIVKEDSQLYRYSNDPTSGVKKSEQTDQNSKRINSLIFTSGSTSTAKGCIVTNEHWRVDIEKQISHELLEVEASYCPQALGSDRVTTWGALLKGGRVVYCRRGIYLFEDLMKCNPTGIVTPPSIFNSIYNEYHSELLELQQKGEEQQIKDLGKKFSRLFGRRLRMIGIGGAFVSPELFQFIKNVLQLPVVEGYGASECGGIATNGIINSDVKFRLIDVPEMGYFNTDIPFPRGELVVKTSYTIPGYFNNEKESNESFTDDGYYITGDIVELNPENNSIKIIDRRKNIFKLAISEFVSPTKLESIYEQIDEIENCCIYGDSSREYIVAIVRTVHNGCNDKRQILKSMHQIAKLHNVRPFEIPRDVIFDDDEWTIENNLLTPSGKVSRFKIYKKHTKSIEDCYSTHANDNEVLFTVDDIEQNFISLCKSILETEDLDMNKSFTELGGSSMKAVKLLFSVQRLFNISQTPISILIHQPLSTVCQVLSMGSSNKLMHHFSTQQNQNLFLEVENDLLLDESIQFVEKEKQGDHSILLTGATGFVGTHLLDKLCNRFPSCTIYCVVRGASDNDAKERVVRSLTNFQLKPDLSNVKVLCGDVSKEQFAFEDSSKYELLLNHVNSIYHVAAQVEFSKSYSHLKNSNVNSVKHLLRFISQSPIEIQLHHVSTISVFGELLTKNPILTEIDSIGDSFKESGVVNSDGYSQTKWVSEKLLQKAAERGFKAFKIYRLGLCSWSHQTGIPNSSDWFTKFIQSIVQLQKYPDTNEKLSLVPVDYVCDTIIDIASSSSSTPRIFHIINNNSPIPFKLFIHYLETSHSTQGHLTKLPYSNWIEQVNEKIAIYPLLPYIKHGFPSTPKFTDNHSQHLRSIPSCPDTTQLYVSQLKLSNI